MRKRLPAEITKKLKEFGKADIVVGLPSRNVEETVANVIIQIDKGLRKYFPRKSCIIISSDSSGENSKTQKNIRSAFKKIETPALLINSGKGKGNQIYDLLLAAKVLGAEALCLFDTDLKSIEPEWVKNVAEPIISNQFDFVTPNYIRHKYDGTITNSIIYPLMTVLYGREIRQPIGGDFGLSKRLINACLKENSWDEDVGFFGIDIWLTTIALCRFKRVAQANLGVKIHEASIKDPRYPEKSIGDMFGQVVRTMFNMAERYSDRWTNINEIYHASFYGPEAHLVPKKVNLNFDYLYGAAMRTAKEKEEFWKKNLGEKIFRKVQKIFQQKKGGFSLDQEFWVDIIYEYAFLYCKKRNQEYRKKLVDSLMPIYFARIASFSKEAKHYTNEEAEAKFKNLVRLFFEKKKNFVLRWDGERTITGLHLRRRVKEAVGL